MSRRTRVVIVLIVVELLLAGGWFWLHNLALTSSNAGPIVDTVIAVPVLGAGVLAIVAGAGEKCGSSCYGPSSGAAVAIGAVLTGLGALALSSAITGYGRTADCRRAREALPEGPTPTSRYVLDVQALADVRARGNQ